MRLMLPEIHAIKYLNAVNATLFISGLPVCHKKTKLTQETKLPLAALLKLV